MLEFKPIKPDDYQIINSFLKNKNEFSCEKTFVNLFGWQKLYNNMYAIEDDVLISKSGIGENEHFQLPYCIDLEKGIKMIKDYLGGKTPKFFVQSGARFEAFKELYYNDYHFENCRDAYDYVYLTEDLANLSGKKYHSKRNHISTFSKNYNWHFEEIDKNNLEKVKACANLWYSENANRSDKYMQAEKENMMYLLDNYFLFNLFGGAIVIDEKIVAFTVASKINDEVLDVHFEKALNDYRTAYAVINNQFAKFVKDKFKYLNREDDLGLLGIRKAKLSYHPKMLIQKYLCTDKYELEKSIIIYREAFGNDGEFEDRLFSNCFKYLKTYKKANKTVSQCFALPVQLKTENFSMNGCYLYAAATLKSEQNKGYMTSLIEDIKEEYDFVITYPSNNNLSDFYKKFGFNEIDATTAECDNEIIPLGDFITVADKEEVDLFKKYKLLIYSKKSDNIQNLKFKYIMD